MTWIEDLLSDTRFWAFHFVGSSGHISPGLDETGCGEYFGMSPDDAWNWLKEATDIGSGKEIGVRIAQNEGVSLHLDLTEEMDYWIENDSRSESFLLANVGGHWLLPGLRWRELMGISQFAHPALPQPKASS